MGELKVSISQSVGKIDFNFAECKAVLAEKLKGYKGIIITSETVDTEKKEVTYLRSQIKVIEDARKKAKEECLRSYKEFEPLSKELVSLIDEAIKEKNDQLEVFEKERIEKKKKVVQGIYNELIGDIGAYLPLDKIYDSKWENKGPTEKAIREEIEKVVSSTEMAITTIKGMNSPSVPKALEHYKLDLSLSNAISYVTKQDQLEAEIKARLEQERKEEEERKRIAEENRLKEMERQRVLEEERKRVAEENRIREVERQRTAELERIREEERIKAEEKVREVEEVKAAEPIEEESFPISESVQEDYSEEPFLVESVEEPFTAEPVEDVSELPFVTVGEITSSFTVVGTLAELEQVELYLNSIGLYFERKDA